MKIVHRGDRRDRRDPVFYSFISVEAQRIWVCDLDGNAG